MDTKLFVGNLSYTTTEEELQELFSQAGVVKSVSVIKDRATGRSKGFAFIEMSNQSEVEQAIKLFNGTTFGNREIKVDIAKEKEQRPSSGGYDDRYRQGGSKDRKRRTGGSSSNRY
jgi:RNA recognition motif-containing protein